MEWKEWGVLIRNVVKDAISGDFAGFNSLSKYLQEADQTKRLLVESGYGESKDGLIGLILDLEGKTVSLNRDTVENIGAGRLSVDDVSRDPGRAGRAFRSFLMLSLDGDGGRLGPIGIGDYQRALKALADGVGQLEPDGNVCAVCGDNGHQAWECHHNPARAMWVQWGYRCYHCGGLFFDKAAADHFGELDEQRPVACNALVGVPGSEIQVDQVGDDPDPVDIVGRFIRDACVLTPKMDTTGADLWDAFKTWWGVELIGGNMFIEHLKDRCVWERRGGVVGVIWFSGICVRKPMRVRARHEIWGCLVQAHGLSMERTREVLDLQAGTISKWLLRPWTDVWGLSLELMRQSMAGRVEDVTFQAYALARGVVLSTTDLNVSNAVLGGLRTGLWTGSTEGKRRLMRLLWDFVAEGVDKTG